ncbi:UNKNOWN [Stylonychia lemnae]|uniref:Cadg domain containing protein n=1 Tax=Stylonychia lemnae TaxID=5949 RepID=A0A078ANX6_STYLE|nr:UNKNOWN [Stylonychia lemnae]|eukprot:CDW83854.1 UNKNOWN [Stylonychia lemnae]
MQIWNQIITNIDLCEIVTLKIQPNQNSTIGAAMILQHDNQFALLVFNYSNGDLLKLYRKNSTHDKRILESSLVIQATGEILYTYNQIDYMVLMYLDWQTGQYYQIQTTVAADDAITVQQDSTGEFTFLQGEMGNYLPVKQTMMILKGKTSQKSKMTTLYFEDSEQYWKAEGFSVLDTDPIYCCPPQLNQPRFELLLTKGILSRYVNWEDKSGYLVGSLLKFNGASYLNKSTLSNVTYYTGANPIYINIENQQISNPTNGNTCPDQQNLFNISSNFVTNYDKNLQILKIQSTSPTLEGVYLMKVFQKINNNQVFLRNFTIKVASLSLSPCQNLTFQTGLNSNSTYFYVFGDPVQVINYRKFQLNANISECGLNYYLMNSDITPVDPTIISYDNNKMYFNVSTTLLSQVKTYDLAISVQVQNSNISSGYNISLVVQHPCIRSKLTPSILQNMFHDIYSYISTSSNGYSTVKVPFQLSITKNCNQTEISEDYQLQDQIYTIGDSAMLILIDMYQVSQYNCGPLNYTDEISLGAIQPLDQYDFIQNYNKSNRTFEVYTTNLSLQGSYQFQISAKLNYGQNQQKRFNLDLKNPYRFKFDNLHEVCGKVLHELIMDQANIQPSTYSFNNISMEFSIVTQDLSLCQTTKKFSLHYYLENFELATDKVDFNVFNECGCDSNYLDNIQESYKFTYILGDGKQKFNTSIFANSNDLCLIDTINYYLKFPKGGSNFFNLITLTSGTLLVIEDTFNISYIGSYQFKITGQSFFRGNSITNDTNILLTVKRGCNTALITSYGNLNETIIKYKVGDPKIVINVKDWVIEQKGCGNFSYQIGLNNTTNITYDFFSYNKTSQNLTIFTTNNSIAGSFSMKQYAYLNSYINQTIYFMIQITNCETKKLNIPPQKQIYTYVIGQEAAVIPILPFIADQDCELSINYSASIKSDKGQDFSGQIMFSQEFRSIYVKSELRSLAGIYYISVLGQLLQDTNLILNNLIIKLSVTTQKNNAPTFSKEIQSFFPDIIDKENDFVEIILANQPDFVKLWDKMLLVEPSDLKHLGDYQFQVILKDSNIDPQSTQYNMKLTIYESQSSDQSLESPSAEYLKMTEEVFELDGIKINKKQLTGKISASVKSIDQNGRINVFFDSKLLKPSKINPLIDFKALKFYLKRSDGKVQYLNTNLNTTPNDKTRNLEQIELSQSQNWNITEFKSNQISIQLSFPQPLDVSTSQVSNSSILIYQEYDQLDIKFNERYFFVSDDKRKVIQPNYQIIHEVPPQLPNNASTASSAITGAVTTNIFLSLVMGLSLKKLWMLIQTLQIIVHLPLLQIPLPSNTILCFKSIVDISNMNVIPKEYIKTVVSAFVSDSSSNVKENFRQMDIFQLLLSNSTDYFNYSKL